MNRKALITAIEPSATPNGEPILYAAPVTSAACASCTAGCEKRQHVFAVANPNGIEVRVGSLVLVGAPKRIQAVEGILALLVPFFFAIAGYFCAAPIASCFGQTVSEGWRASMVLLFLFASSALMVLVTRKLTFPSKPHILSLC
ncbi:MAG: SoxR reducing system RseC family protein [Treponema sp.]|nr:SoxR reducing system RseC family protein [Treponema sp.]